MTDVLRGHLSRKNQGKGIEGDKLLRSQEMCPRHQMTRIADKSDLMDEEWRIIEPLIPPAKSGGHLRTVDLREVVNAIFYLLGTGCSWQMLAHDFPLG